MSQNEKDQLLEDWLEEEDMYLDDEDCEFENKTEEQDEDAALK